ncbi:MAG: GH3 auxin-responsive promoter family protein [bacterium]|nr:GH3 auxin-responsive promoter family protein [bacterium]
MIDATPLVKQYSTFRLRQLKKQHVADIQKKQLLTLVKRAQSTQFGTQYHFQDIRTIEDYLRTVPLRIYDDFRQDFWGQSFPNLIDCTWPGKIPFFSVTSGTTSDRAKYIPVSKEMIRSNSKGSLDLFCHHLSNNPHSQILKGKGFMFGGITSLTELSPNVYAGSLPGILLQRTMPWWVKLWYMPIDRIVQIPDMDDKTMAMAQEALRHDIRSISGIPSWLLVLFEKWPQIRSFGRDFRLIDYFPHLEMMVHGGVSLTPYRQRFSQILEGSRCDLREIYPSSEGFFAIADRQPGEGLRLVCDHGIFYEFVPMDEFEHTTPTRYWIETVQTGVEYALVISTCAGLWSYIQGDVVKFVDLDPPRFLITGRTSSVLSIFSEKVNEETINLAIATAAEAIGASIIEFTVGAGYPQTPGERGRYICIVEFQQVLTGDNDRRRFTETVEQTIIRHNAIYEQYVPNGWFDPPELQVVIPGTFARWLKHLEKPEGKVPRIIADTEKFNALLAFVREYRSGT